MFFALIGLLRSLNSNEICFVDLKDFLNDDTLFEVGCYLDT